ncbi:MAG: group 1 truncated hemoglobin [Anaerolineales bacterium]|nr:group 1 truncated hemoglobin [Anaerolineales bacterium]
MQPDIVNVPALQSEHAADVSTAAGPSLYDRMGGQAAIQAVVDEFLKNVAADNRINKFFANTDLARLNKLLVEQICQGSGGPCIYTGRSMKESHMGLGISDADFNALVEDLVKALDTFNVPEQEQNDLLSILGPMQPDIVETSAAPSALPATGGMVADVLSNVWTLLTVGIGLLVAGSWLARRRAQG